MGRPVHEEYLRAHAHYEGAFVDTLTGLMWRRDDEDVWQRTFPSWEKRRIRELIIPDMQLGSVKDDQNLIRMIEIELRNAGLDGNAGVRRVDMTDAIDRARRKKRGGWRELKRLWRCGLVDRTGTRWNERGRWRNQLWHVRAMTRESGPFRR